jgi:hypothetical protein
LKVSPFSNNAALPVRKTWLTKVFRLLQPAVQDSTLERTVELNHN